MYYNQTVCTFSHFMKKKGSKHTYINFKQNCSVFRFFSNTAFEIKFSVQVHIHLLKFSLSLLASSSPPLLLLQNFRCLCNKLQQEKH